MKNVKLFGLLCFSVLVLVGCNAVDASDEADPFAELRTEIESNIDELEARLDYILENFEGDELNHEVRQLHNEAESYSTDWRITAFELGEGAPFVSGETYCLVADLGGCIDMPELYRFQNFMNALAPYMPQG